jgi:predicted dehydrogenase
MARKYDVPNVYTDYRALIEKGGLDAVVVAVPDDLHYPMTIDALDEGLHVLCEKPLAHSADEAREMYQKAEAAGVKHMTCFTYRWMPYYRHLKQLISDGYLGAPYHCHMRYLGGYGRRPSYQWKWDRRRADGILGDLGPHMIDLARWYFGDIGEVNARLSTFVQRPGIDDQPLDPANDSALLTLQFENGAVGVIQVSAVAHVGDRGQEQHVVLHGADGTLEVDVDSARGYAVRGARQDENVIQALPTPDALLAGADVNTPFMDQMMAIFRTQSVGTRLFVDAIVADRPLSPSFYDGLKVQEVIDAANKSDEGGCWVSLP